MQQLIKIHKLTGGRCGSKPGRYGGDGAAVRSHLRQGRVGWQGYCCCGLGGRGHRGLTGWSHWGSWCQSRYMLGGEKGRLVNP